MPLMALVAVIVTAAAWKKMGWAGILVGLIIGFIGIQIWHGATGTLAPCYSTPKVSWWEWLRFMPFLCR